MRTYKAKRLLIFTVLIMLTYFFTSHNSYALSDFSNNSECIVEDLGNGYYCETVIIEDSFDDISYSLFSASKTITKTKTASIKNSKGNILWSVSIRATFSFNGKTSICTNYSHSTTAPAKSWSIVHSSSSKNSNAATATATAKHTSETGYKKYTKSVTIRCSATGVIS